MDPRDIQMLGAQQVGETAVPLPDELERQLDFDLAADNGLAFPGLAFRLLADYAFRGLAFRLLADYALRMFAAGQHFGTVEVVAQIVEQNPSVNLSTSIETREMPDPATLGDHLPID